MSSSLDVILSEASEFINSEFGLQLEKSQLKPYSLEDWQTFCQTNNFDPESEGLYVPNSHSAYVRVDSPVLVSNIFHEFFGHGLFCEYSQIGKSLATITQGDADAFLYDEVNPIIQPLGLCSRNIGNYEGFALWLESLLCEETGNTAVWELKKDRLPEQYIDLFEYFHDAEQKLTRFGLMSQLGFPKSYDSEKLLQTLKHFSGDSFAEIDFIVLYGSQKPESDIDLFIVSTHPSQNYFDGWLDIYGLNREEFEYRVNHLDLSVTDPLFSGTLIYGDENYFEQLKQRIQEQPITLEAVNHNLAKAQKQMDYLPSFENMPRERKSCLSYIDSLTRNVEELRKGNKLLTLQNLMSNT